MHPLLQANRLYLQLDVLKGPPVFLKLLKGRRCSAHHLQPLNQTCNVPHQVQVILRQVRQEPYQATGVGTLSLHCSENLKEQVT